MFSLFRRSNGIYYVLSGTKHKRTWKSTGARSKEEALQRLLGARTTPEPAPSPAPSDSSPVLTLAGFRTELLAYARASFAPKTVELYALSLSRLQEFLGDKSLAAISPRDVDAYKAQRLKAGASPVSLNIEIRTLRAAFHTATRWGLTTDLLPLNRSSSYIGLFTKGGHDEGQEVHSGTDRLKAA